MGEIVFLPGELHCILNINESKITTGGTNNVVGGQQSNKYGTNDPNLPQGANTINKASSCSIFIDRSTLVGDLILLRFQMNNKAQEKNRYVKDALLYNMIHVCGKYQFSYVIKHGVTINLIFFWKTICGSLFCWNLP